MTEVEICNQALLKLGQSPIMSMEDNSVLARKCKQEFGAALGVVLRAYQWPFAIKRVSLPLSSELPEFGYAKYYVLPRDIARIQDIDTAGYKYQIEGQNIATDAPYANIRYVTKDVAITALDDQTVEVVALQLAYRLSIVITENMQLKDMLLQEYDMALTHARNIWSVEDYPQESPEGTWITSRGGTVGIQDTYNPWGADGTGVTSWPQK